MSVRIVDAEEERKRRELPRRIGRLRRRIDARIRASQREARRLASWRTYVRRSPGNAVLGALGVGLALSAGLSARRLSRWLGMRLIRHAADHAWGQVRRELRQIWADSTPGKTTSETRGADHDGA